MRYRKKEIGCEIKYSELDLRAIKYISEFEKDEFETEVQNSGKIIVKKEKESKPC